jgi:hypothetical protein
VETECVSEEKTPASEGGRYNTWSNSKNITQEHRQE